MQSPKTGVDPLAHPLQVKLRASAWVQVPSPEQAGEPVVRPQKRAQSVRLRMFTRHTPLLKQLSLTRLAPTGQRVLGSHLEGRKKRKQTKIAAGPQPGKGRVA